jgi:predicted permease
MLNADLGFDMGNVLVMAVSLPEARYADDAQRLEFRERVESGIRQVAGARLEGLAFSGGLLPSLGLSFGTFAAEGEEPLPGFTNVAAHFGRVSPGFFATLGVPLVDGRDFTADDVGHPDNPVIVNAGWARRMWDDERAAGRRIESEGRDGLVYRTVVGVIHDARLTGATGPFNELQIYYPGMAFETLGLMIRTSGDPLPLAGAIREQIWAIDPNLPINGVSLLDRVYAGGLAMQRFNATLMGVFAGVAVLLALIGVYGVLSYSIGQRTREIGIRMALGASGSAVVPMVVWGGMRLVLAGIVVGMFGALALTRFLESLLYEVSAIDPPTYLGVALALTVVAALACMIPARRAARLDAMAALRGE